MNNIYTEITPNPASIKFVVDKSIIASGAFDFPTRQAAEGASALAEELFTLPFTGGVFFGRNFVTLTKSDETRWEDAIPVVKETIKRFLESGAPILNNLDENVSVAEESEIVQKIKNIIEEQVRPAVAMDGGDIIFEGFHEGTVQLRLRGSCSGCPSSMITLKSGIESLLIRLFPNDVKAVEAV